MASKAFTYDPSLGSYAEKIARIPMLTPEEERDLTGRVRDHHDQAAADRIVEAHLKLVVKLAAGYRGYGLPLADLVSEGTLGLIRAVQKFEPERGFRVSTYAMWWIKASIQEYILRSWSLVRMGTTADQKALFFGLARAKRKLGIPDGHALVESDAIRISEMTGTSTHTVLEMSRRMAAAVSLNAPINAEEADSGELQDLLASPGARADDILIEEDERQQRMALLGQALLTLKPRERQIFEARRLGENPPTLEEIGSEFGVTRERIRQIENTAFLKVQKRISALAYNAGM